MTTNCDTVLPDSLIDSAVGVHRTDEDTVVPSGITIATIKMDECSGCPQINDHNPWKHLVATTSPNAEADQQNNLREFLRRYQTLILHYYRGFWATKNDIRGLSGINNTNFFLSWPVVSFVVNTLTLRYTEGTTDPRKFSWDVRTINPEWVGQPDVPRLLTTTFENAVPANGIINFGNSQAAFHGGFQVYRIVCPSTMNYGDTFQMLVYGYGDNATTMAKFPHGNTEPVTAYYTFYTLGFESYVEPRKAYPFKGVRTTVRVTSDDLNPSNQYEFKTNSGASCRIKWPQQQGDIVILRQNLAGEWSDITSGFDQTNMWVEHHTTLRYKSWIDLSDWVGSSKAFHISYFYEDSSGVWIGQNRCKNSVEDTTGSWGQFAGEPSSYFCKYRKEATKAALYKPECYETRCNHFETDIPTKTTDQDLWNQIMFGLAWREMKQVTDSGTLITLQHIGVAGLFALFNGVVDVPPGWHTEYAFPDVGKMEALIKSAPVRGWEFLEWMINPESGSLQKGLLPDIHPFGNVGGEDQAKYSDYEDNVVGTDPYKINQAMCNSGARDISAYTGVVGGPAWFKYQRITQQVKLVIPAIRGESDKLCGRVEHGSWGINYTEVDPFFAHYRAKIVIPDGVLADRTWSEPFGETKLVVEVSKIVNEGGGLIRIELRNGIVVAGSPGGYQSDITTSWRNAGTNVPLPPHARMINYLSSQATIGPMRNLIYEGDCIQMDSSDYAGLKCKDKRFWIEKAIAAWSGGTTQTWWTDSFDLTTEDDYYNSYIALHWSSLPREHKSFANKPDTIWVRDENSGLAEIIAAHTADWWQGKILTIKNNGIFKDAITIQKSQKGTETTETVTDAGYWLATGEIYLPNAPTWDDCYILTGLLANRWTIPREQDFRSLKTFFEKTVRVD